MQQLHLVGLTADHTGLILTARRGAKTGKYSIAADEKLLAAVQEAQRLLRGGEEVVDEAAGEGEEAAPKAALVALPAPPPAKPVSSLSPREIQGRLRAGGSVKEIAAAAGVGEEWILRFADPIRAEQARVVEGAQKITFNKPRLGLSAEPLEKSVLLNLAERGVRLPADVFASAWTAFNLHGTSWAVLFSYVSRQRRQTAQWEVDLRSGELMARNRLASDLGYLEPGRRRRRLEPLEVPGEEESPPPARRLASRAATAARTAQARNVLAAAKPAGTKAATGPRKVVATRATRGKKAPAAGKRSAAKRAPAANTTPPVKKGPEAAKVTNPRTKGGAGKSSPAANKAPATKKVPGPKKGGSRQSAPRVRRPAKKPEAEKPARQPAATLAASAPPLPDRPSHLARPPSPMNLTNRPLTLPGRLVGAPSLRPPLPSPRRPAPPRPRPRPEPEEGKEATPAAPPERDPARRGPVFAPSDSPPPEPASDPRTDRSTGAENGDGEAAGDDRDGPRVRRRRSERRITPRKEGDEPSVVILSTPAVRRLEPPEEISRRAPAPRS